MLTKTTANIRECSNYGRRSAYKYFHKKPKSHNYGRELIRINLNAQEVDTCRELIRINLNAQEVDTCRELLRSNQNEPQEVDTAKIADKKIPHERA